jgi:hypothetical protein
MTVKGCSFVQVNFLWLDEYKDVVETRDFGYLQGRLTGAEQVQTGLKS